MPKYDPADRCQESATYQTDKVKLDKAKGILRDVKVLGFTSVKKRNYQRNAVEKALPLYDGIRVNLDHVRGDGPDLRAPAVSIRNRFGRLFAPRLEPDGLYANLRYNPKHEY